MNSGRFGCGRESAGGASRVRVAQTRRSPNGFRRTRAGPSSRLHPLVSAGPYVTAPHSQRHVKCRPHEHAIEPTSIRPGRSRCPRGHTSGAWTIHCPLLQISSPTTKGMTATLLVLSRLPSPCIWVIPKPARQHGLQASRRINLGAGELRTGRAGYLVSRCRLWCRVRVGRRRGHDAHHGCQ